jgi:hypothetical protein
MDIDGDGGRPEFGLRGQRRGTESEKGTAANSLSGQGKIAAQQIRDGTADKPTAKRFGRICGLLSSAKRWT